MKITHIPEKLPLYLDDIQRMPLAFVGSDITLLAFIRYCTEKYGYACYNQNTLFKHLNMTEPTYRRSRDKLIKNGFIARIYKAGTSATSGNHTVAFIYIPTTMTHPDEFIVGDIVRVNEPAMLSTKLQTIEAVNGNTVKLKGYMSYISTTNNNVIKIREAIK